ncbi:MAG: tRNA preQ1(34) S-adenosylmethionine ribosyltransferase-isomerase QueA [Clostridiales Family XIII bacterium]|jgi:S-adenosylmethionine:tRNA ribosyltransferase-isomerase|nr:tRNA preQ1(34) S-adenosylmethionine ribosyltransferase-isomerase QueA [Clostridiales Family XIII bacterium]
MLLREFDYALPAELIARYPADRRDASRLMVLHRGTGRVEHRRFYDILTYLKAGDCLVLNDSKVLPARLFGVRERAGTDGAGARVECLLVRRVCGDTWEIMARPGKRLRRGDVVRFTENGDFAAEVLDCLADGLRLVAFRCAGDFMERLSAVGRMPLPPYIGRAADETDKTRYQTVYARAWGSVAAPTAGLHFTEELLRAASEAGVHTARLTLHVGPGTFRPVKAERVEEHTMHLEEYEVGADCAARVNAAIAEKRRVVCVGTTSARALESAAFYDRAAGGYRVAAGRAGTDIFIYPGYAFKCTDALLTNFHLPKSTLLMLVSAFYDREAVLRAYAEAVTLGYRFFSYGDAMLMV